jgi:Putative zinc-finger
MICRRAARLLCFDVGGDLDPRRRSAVAEHVAICPACRGFRAELSATLETARSLAVPALEHGREELRRRVWREIQKDRDRANTRNAERFRLVIAAAGCSAAILLFLRFLASRPPAEFRPVVPHAVSPAIAWAPVPAGPARESAPTLPAPALPKTALASRPPADARESGGITRIEFRTPDPQVRIIWFVGQQAPESSPAPAPGPKQEVS